MTNVLDAVKNGFNFVKDHILGLGKEAVQWGKDLIMGIVNGIKGAIGYVKDAVCSVGDTIRSSFFHNIAGFGFKDGTQYEQVGTDFIPLEELFSQGEMSGRILFGGASAYDEEINRFLGKFRACNRANQMVLLNTLDFLAEQLLALQRKQNEGLCDK